LQFHSNEGNLEITPKEGAMNIDANNHKDKDHRIAELIYETALAELEVNKLTKQIQELADEDSDKVGIKWAWEDVQSLRPDLDEDECLEMLDQIAKGLHDRSIEIGWEIMETLISMEG
jgi:hypothetical protein